MRFIRKPINTRPHFKRSKRKLKVKNIAFIFLLVVFTGGLAFGVLFSGLLDVRRIKLTGIDTLDSDEVTQLVKQEIRSPLFKSNILFVNPQKLSVELKKKYPIIIDVSIKRKFPLDLEVRVSERAPSFALKTQSKYYLVGSDGLITEQLFSQRKDILELQDIANAPAVIGKKQFSREFIRFFIELDQGLKTQAISIESYQIPETTFEIRAKVKNSYEIQFDTTTSVDVQLDKLKLISSYFRKKKIRPAKYVNLTVENRVYYR